MSSANLEPLSSQLPPFSRARKAQRMDKKYHDDEFDICKHVVDNQRSDHRTENMKEIERVGNIETPPKASVRVLILHSLEVFLVVDVSRVWVDVKVGLDDLGESSLSG